MAIEDNRFLDALHDLCVRDGLSVGRFSGNIRLVSISQDYSEFDVGIMEIQLYLTQPTVRGKSRSYDAESTAEDMPIELPGAPKQLPPKVAS